LPRYRRYLNELRKKGVDKISSNEFSHLTGYTASQIRQDLNNFGGFGQQGYGYNIKNLHDEIAKILNIDNQHEMIIVGAGHLGQALANYAKFEKNSFHVVGLFDNNKALKRKMVRDIPIMMIDELPGFLQKNDVEIAALTLPKENAIDMAQILVENGIHAIWNFAHTDLNLVVPKTVAVQNVHLSESLMRLSYNLKTLEEEGEIK
jgi:redox-sensing transcriptional repressor